MKEYQPEFRSLEHNKNPHVAVVLVLPEQASGYRYVMDACSLGSQFNHIDYTSRLHPLTQCPQSASFLIIISHPKIWPETFCCIQGQTTSEEEVQPSTGKKTPYWIMDHITARNLDHTEQKTIEEIEMKEQDNYPTEMNSEIIT